MLVHPSGLPAGTCPILAGSPNQACELEGNPFPRAPKFTFNATYEHSFDLSNGGSLTPSGTARYSSSYFVTSQEQTLLGHEQPSYWTGDLSLHYAAPGDRWSATAYLKNVNNQVIRQSWFVQYVQIAPPRTYGVVVSAKF